MFSESLPSPRKKGDRLRQQKKQKLVRWKFLNGAGKRYNTSFLLLHVSFLYFYYYFADTCGSSFLIDFVQERKFGKWKTNSDGTFLHRCNFRPRGKPACKSYVKQTETVFFLNVTKFLSANQFLIWVSLNVFAMQSTKA
jgi:hypothetical protein